MTSYAKFRLEVALRERFYFIDYPNPVPADCWKDGNGKYQPMLDMTLDHLKASISLVKKQRNVYCQKQAKDVAFPEVSAILLPLIDEKLAELERVFRKKAAL